MDRGPIIVGTLARPDDPAAAAERLAKFKQLLAKLDGREMTEVEAFMRRLGASERIAGVAS